MRGDNPLMLRKVFSVVLALCASALTAQVPTATAPTPKSLAGQGSPARDSKALAKNLLESYYHPDHLSSISCDVSIDWPALFQAVKADVHPERLAALQGLKIRSKAVRGQAPQLTLDWGDKSLDTKEQMENGLKDMIGGFYRAYWPMLASPLVKSSAEFSKVEPLADGSSDIYESDGNMSVVIRVDREGVPVHYSLDGPAMKGTIEARYAPSPQPRAGDMRRISSLSLSEQIGNSNMNVAIDLDYQSVDGFNIPQHVSFGLPGAYSVKMDFSGCTVTSEKTDAQ
jgi:hypothetical protein